VSKQVVTEAEARRAHRVLQAIWMIASAQHNDSVARDVAALGEELRSHIDASDWTRAAQSIAKVQSWLATMAGVVTSRMQKVFEANTASG
jgi:hypothetical protein